MADFKISDLPLADPMTGTELMEVVQGGVSKKAVMTFLSATSAATKNVGTAPDQVPLNSDLGAIPKVINFTSATGTVEITDTLPSMAIGDRVLVRKLNATQGTVTITCTGHTFTRSALSYVGLNSDGDFWLIEKVSATRLDLVDGVSSGASSTGTWYRKVGTQRCDTIATIPAMALNGEETVKISLPAGFKNNPFVSMTIQSPTVGSSAQVGQLVRNGVHVRSLSLTEISMSSYAYDVAVDYDNVVLLTSTGDWY